MWVFIPSPYTNLVQFRHDLCMLFKQKRMVQWEKVASDDTSEMRQRAGTDMVGLQVAMDILQFEWGLYCVWFDISLVKQRLCYGAQSSRCPA
ncbi:hypothetical protein KCU83_g613, partial [Aureobasidium melanogenum]